MDFRIGFGYDSHRFAPGRALVLGGIAVPYHLGLEAHSDGDVLIHAICDAILGAAGHRDIGTWFPNTDPKWKNADSKVLLSKVVETIAADGWKVNNLDCTLVLEAPKMKPYIEDITSVLSEVLCTESSRIAVKAKTNEGMGAIGAGEGIAAFAVVSIVKL